MMAIGVVLLGLGALLALTLSNVAASNASRERIVATQLAREALEVVRGIRDSNWLAISNGGVVTCNYQGGSAPALGWDTCLVEATSCTTGCNGAFISFNDLYPYGDASHWTPYAVVFTGNRDINQSDYQLFRNDQYHQWTQFAGGTTGSGYSATGFRRLVTLDPVCRDSSGNVTVAVGAVGCGTNTKIGLRASVEVDWPTAGLFGGAVRRSLVMSEFLYNWR